MKPLSHPPEVLLVTHSRDYYNVDRVKEELERRGARAWRLDTDLFPSEVRLAIRVGPQGCSPLLTLPDGARLDPDRIVAVWIRKILRASLPEDVDPRLVPGCQAESRSTLAGLWESLPRARFLDLPGRMLEAEAKIRQLRLATASGLVIPRTVVTNDPAEVRRLHSECGGRIVAKLLHALSTSMGRAPLSVHTSEVREADLQDLDGLSLSPMVFQERIEKDLELRVAYVGGRCFAGAVDARRSAEGKVDWRMAAPDECSWQAAELPESEQRKLGKLMGALGLRFGAVDFIRTPEGEHVFLEVNAAGEWGMLEKDLGLPISAAIAEELLRS